MSLDRRRFRTLVDWREGRLGADEAAAVEAWVGTGDADVVEALTWIDSFLQSVGSLRLEDPPPLVSRRLRRLVRPPDRRSPVVHEQAMVVEDSRQRPIGAGLRGGGAEAFQITARSASAELLLDVQPDGPESVRIHGQILPGVETDPAFEARSVGGHREVRSVDGDDLGGFSLANVPLDARGIIVTNDALTVELAIVLRP